MVDDPKELILEHLRRFDERQGRFEQMLKDQRDLLIGIRGDMLRQDRAIATIEDDISRIKARLDLSDSADS